MLFHQILTCNKILVFQLVTSLFCLQNPIVHPSYLNAQTHAQQSVKLSYYASHFRLVQTFIQMPAFTF